jgi:hypothetical protein
MLMFPQTKPHAHSIPISPFLESADLPDAEHLHALPLISRHKSKRFFDTSGLGAPSKAMEQWK